MAVSKKALFDQQTNRLAEFSRALAHPARVEILRTLGRMHTCVCGELVSQMPLAQSTVSQHLKELKEIGLVKGEIEGPRSCYCLDAEVIAQMRGEMNAFFDKLTENHEQDVCC